LSSNLVGHRAYSVYHTCSHFLSAMDWFSCKGKCGGSDPTSDTVKVDASLLTSEKENVQPLQVQAQRQREEEEKRRAQEEHRLQMQKEAERRQVEEQAKKRREEEEAHCREQAAAERAAAEETARAAAAAAKAKEEEKRRLEAERVANERARHEAEVAQLAEEKRQQELQALSKIHEWCKENGFADMHTKKKGGFISPSKFPLHEAVAKRHEEMISLLLQFGADATVKNSKGQTPADIARKMNKGGSMDTILSKLS